MGLDYTNRVNPEELYAELSSDSDCILESLR